MNTTTPPGIKIYEGGVMIMKIRAIYIVMFSVMLAVFLLGAGPPGDYFTMDDPAGDEHGYGTYQYPTNIAFQPYQGLFDILQFQVKAGPGGVVYFDTTFRKMTNPWAAPEGFIHQNLRIFIDTIPDQGATVLPERGASVRFNPKYAWDVCLKVVGWGNSQLITVMNGTLQAKPLKVELLGDGRTIRAEAPGNIIGNPVPNWHYYVLVGSYDGFGEDFFRKIAPKPGEWVIGGGTGKSLDPRVMDILAPVKGQHRQEKQLHSFDPETGRPAELYPVGRDLAEFNLRGWVLGILLFLILGVLISILKHKRCSISWFWVKGDKNNIASG
jgi:carbohydrate-binding DOMON domain-containing protein